MAEESDAGQQSTSDHPAQAEDAARKPTRQRRAARLKVVRTTAEGYFAAIALRDTKAITAYWDADGIDDVVPVGVLRGPDGIRAFFEELFAAVPDMAFGIERITADRDGAAVQWRARGTFTGSDFRGIGATERRVELRGVDLLEIDGDGLITRNTAYYDGMEFARAIGMLPADGTAADRALRSAFNGVTRVKRTIGDLR